MQPESVPVPVVLVDMEGFSPLKPDEQSAVVARLQEALTQSIKLLIGFTNPKAIIRHGTGDGYYLFLEHYPTPVAMRFALNLENILRDDNANHPNYPLRLRVGLTLGRVGLQGDQYLGEVLTEAARLIDHEWIKGLLKERIENPIVLLASQFFWDNWQNHELRTDPALAYPEERPWICAELTVKHGEVLLAHVQTDAGVFQSIQKKAPVDQGSTSVPDLTPWLKELLDYTRNIQIIGIGSGEGSGQKAYLYPIEQLYTPLKSRNPLGAVDSMDGELRTGIRIPGDGPGSDMAGVSLADLLPKHKRLFIEGDPGSGKTTFLHLAAAMLAKDLLDERGVASESWRKRHLGMDDTKEAPKPLFLKLSELAVLLAKESTLTKKDDRFRLLELLQGTRGADQDPAWSHHWQSLLEAGNVLLLLDGLDEVADETIRERVFAIFSDADEHWRNSQIVVTSRPFGAEKLTKMGFHRAVIEPFGAGETREFINCWSAALFGHAIGKRPTGVAGEKADAMEKAILNRPAIRKLAANPVMLTCLCVVHWNRGQLPEGRSRVYDVVIDWLLGSREVIRNAHGYHKRFAMEAFSAIAFAMMGGKQGNKQTILDLKKAVDIVDPFVSRYFSEINPNQREDFTRKWLRFEGVYSNILVEKNTNGFSFWHLTFQEYLAAKELASMRDDKNKGWWPVVASRLENVQWRETVDLFPGVLLDGNLRFRVDDLLTFVMERYSGSGLAKVACKAGIMNRILEPTKVYGYRPDAVTQEQYQQVLKQAMAIFTLKGAAQVPIKDRLLVAEALGQGGDPRLAEDRWRENLIKVPGTDIALGKYLVTVQEYQRFVEDGGYDNPDHWWEERAWTFRQAEGWQEPSDWANQLDHPNWPVTGVSWYEASAYCRWLQTQRNVEFFLPEEEDWKTAATPAQGKYSWGNAKPTPELANYDKSKIGHATPVGLYPDGNGRYGHCDLAGNVWEWSAASWMDSDFSDENIQKYGPPQVVRGGSWDYPVEDFRAAMRFRNHAVSRSCFLGFRVAAPASTVDP
ncbi:MAG: SUMF1/EgtB/PvdO family nonheme iron enzyme [Magnetococcales bacterium]|nr:SUMF1/EgtB/PvdO family nonheme iron enzyme [Magnetococcales bacterium]